MNPLSTDRGTRLHGYWKSREREATFRSTGLIRSATTVTAPLAFCTMLQTCGYSTSPIYAHTLQTIIIQYNLRQYDGGKESKE